MAEYRDPSLKDLLKHREAIIEAHISGHLERAAFTGLLTGINAIIDAMLEVSDV